MKQLFKDIIKGKILLNGALAMVLINSCAGDKQPQAPIKNSKTIQQQVQKGLILFPYGKDKILLPYGSTIPNIPTPITQYLDEIVFKKTNHQNAFEERFILNNPLEAPYQEFFRFSLEKQRQIIDTYISNRFRVVKQTSTRIWKNDYNFTTNERHYQLGDGSAFLYVKLVESENIKFLNIKSYNSIQNMLSTAPIRFKTNTTNPLIVDINYAKKGIEKEIYLSNKGLEFICTQHFHEVILSEYANTPQSFHIQHRQTYKKINIPCNVLVQWDIDGKKYFSQTNQKLELAPILSSYNLPPNILNVEATLQYDGELITQKRIIQKSDILKHFKYEKWNEALKIETMSQKEREKFYFDKLKEALVNDDQVTIFKYCQLMEYEGLKLPHSFHFIYGKAAFSQHKKEIAKEQLQTYLANAKQITPSYSTQAQEMLAKIK